MICKHRRAAFRATRNPLFSAVRQEVFEKFAGVRYTAGTITPHLAGIHAFEGAAVHSPVALFEAFHDSLHACTGNIAVLCGQPEHHAGTDESTASPLHVAHARTERPCHVKGRLRIQPDQVTICTCDRLGTIM